MREFVAIVVFLLALQINDINFFFFVVSLALSFCAGGYLLLSVLERFIIGRRWFRATPGQAQEPPFEDDISDEEKRQMRRYERIGKEKRYREGDGGLR